MANHPSICIYCGQNEQSVPLLSMQFRGEQFSICPQHLPVLIHQPARLADKLPGLELLQPGEEHHDH